VTGISTTIAPWFDRLQGRSVSIALMGASFGAIVVVPLLVLGTRRFGFTAATAIGALLILCVLAPLALIVLRHRGPETLGLAPDGVPLSARAPAPQSQRTPRQQRATLVPPETVRPWTRATAIRTGALWTTAIGFAFGLTVQVGFLTHHLKLAEPVLGTGGASWLVSATGIAGLLGRVLLASLADRVPVRRYAAAVFAVQAVALGAIAAVPGAPTLIAASLVYGFCLGQITTLSPIVVRREFGAQGFGAIYGIAGTVIQLSSAFGPALYGAMRDLCGAYPPVLAIAAAGELIAMAVVLSGRQPVGA
jgi:predicted MFS family arabinose efflux permease